MTEWQVASMLLALHNIASALGSVCNILLVIVFIKIFK